MSKITVIGAFGGVGQFLSLLIKTNLSAKDTLVLVDINQNVKGLHRDLCAIPKGPRVTCSKDDLYDSDIVVTLAGMPRQEATQTRQDLLEVNSRVVLNVAKDVLKMCPRAYNLVVTNPVNILVPLLSMFYKSKGYDSGKVIGLTALDQIRAESILGKEHKTIGGHSSNTTFVLDKLNKLSEEASKRIVNEGKKVIEEKGSSATASTAYAIYRLITKVISGGEEVVYREINQLGFEFISLRTTFKNKQIVATDTSMVNNLKMGERNQLSKYLKKDIEEAKIIFSNIKDE